jgi:protein SCO1/2
MIARTVLRCFAVLVLAGPLASASAQMPASQVPAELQGVDIIEKLDARLPLDLPFVDEDGKAVTLGDYFERTGGPSRNGRPIILQLGYFKCPMLCGLVLNGAMDGLKGVDWSAGETFDLIAVSINPRETPQLAKVKREGYLLDYNRPSAEKGFHFLTGPESSSHALADAVGFKFREQENGDYSHAAAIFVITPDGRISRYLYGTKFEPKDIRFAMLEASEGRIGSTLDRFILWCHIYDPNARGYVLVAMRLMQIGGALTVLILGGGLAWFFAVEARRRRAEREAAAAASPRDTPHDSRMA